LGQTIRAEECARHIGEPAAGINRYRSRFARAAEIRATFRIRTETDRAADRLSPQRLLPNALPIANSEQLS
jgi:hypothetical protein